MKTIRYACSACGHPLVRDEPRAQWVCPEGHGYVTDEHAHADGLYRLRIDEPCTPQESVMTDTPADTAGSATSSPASHVTASKGTHQPEPDLDFTFKRQPEKVVIAGTTPYVLLTLHDRGVSITGGGLPENAPKGAIVEFLIAAGDTFHDMAKTLAEQEDQ